MAPVRRRYRGTGRDTVVRPGEEGGPRRGLPGKLSAVTVVETILVFAGIPLVIIALLAALTLRGGRKPLRYKPGQPWEHEPVWFEPHPEATGHASGGHHTLPAGVSADGRPLGGARGTW